MQKCSSCSEQLSPLSLNDEQVRVRRIAKKQRTFVGKHFIPKEENTLKQRLVFSHYVIALECFQMYYVILYP